MIVLPVGKLLGVDELDIAHWLSAHGTLVQLLGTPLTCHVMATRTEDGRNQFVHAHIAQLLVLNLHQETKHLPALRLAKGPWVVLRNKVVQNLSY